MQLDSHEVRISKRLFKWIGIFLLGSLCTCPTMLFAPFVMPEVIGQLTVNLTKYPDAHLLYSGSRTVGSGDWKTRRLIFWTSDSADSVQSHYEEFFPAFSPQLSLLDPPVTVRSHTTILSIGMDVGLIDTIQENLSWASLSGWSGDLYGAIVNAPPNGTFIILEHDIFAG